MDSGTEDLEGNKLVKVEYTVKYYLNSEERIVEKDSSDSKAGEKISGIVNRKIKR